MFKLNLNKKAQVAPFMIIIIVVILLAIAATMLIGEAGFNRIRLANTADSAVISGASGLAKSFNQIRAISFGAGGLMVNWTSLQSFLLAKNSKCLCVEPPGAGMNMFPVWEYLGQPLATGTVINAIQEIDQLHDNAESIAKKAPNDLREGIYGRILGGGLIDEAKPFIDKPDVDNDPEDEVKRDDRGRIIALNYDLYLNRDYPYQEALRTLKATDSSWYDNDQISYSFNKKGSEAVAQPGVLQTAEPSNDYGCYLTANLEDVPKSIDVDYQALPLLYFYQKQIHWWDGTTPKCACIMIPSFLLDPYAWITDINMVGGNSFGVKAEKKMDFRSLPFFSGQPVVEHKNKVRIKGNVWSGYDFGLEE